jgi:hypothetical protein
MKRRVIAGLCIALAASAFADTRGDEIARSYFGLSKASDTKANATMTLIDKAGGKKVRKLEINYRETDEGKDAYLVFSSPADVAGTKFLTLAHKGAAAEQRLYLPALKKTRKISSSGKDGAFVNSDFYFYDLEDRRFEDNTYAFVAGDVTIADKAFEGMKFDKIEMRSVDANSPYAKCVAYANQADHFIYKLECFDKKDGALLKTFLFVKVESFKGHLVPTQTVVTNNKNGTKTLLAMENIQVDVGAKAELFSEKNLEK